MDFTLRYRGPLPANGGVKVKHEIRTAIHSQLERLCDQQPHFQQATLDSLPKGVLKGREVEVPRPLKVMFFHVPLGGFNFVPLVHRPHELACSLDILFLRREKPGAIIQHGGDLDNRLKTLFDALRMPHDASEVSGLTPASRDQRIYCLLEDDSLITHLSVKTHQLLEPIGAGENASTVELLVHVSVHPTHPMVANIGI